MVIYENHCVSCNQPCFGENCVNQNVKVFICDGCGEVLCDGYYDDGEGFMLCEECCLSQCFREFSECDEEEM